MRGRLPCALLAMLLAFAACPGAARAAAGAVPPGFYGINVDRLFNDRVDPRELDAQLARARAAGIREARADAMWDFLEPWGPSGGAPVLGETDRRAAALAAHDLRWAPVLDYTPRWQQTIPGDYHSAPREPGAFASFAAAFARRYGRGGSFWADHPELPRLPVLRYEIWNEENGRGFWNPRPQPDRYAALYAAARTAIHAVDPGAMVMVGGLVNDAGGFLERMAASRPGLRGHIDAVAVHPYGRTWGAVLRRLGRLRDRLARLGTPDMPIVITEVGWRSQGARRERLFQPDPERARSLRHLLAALVKRRAGLRLLAVMPYTLWAPGCRRAGEVWGFALFGDRGAASRTGLAYFAAIRRRHPTAHSQPD